MKRLAGMISILGVLVACQTANAGPADRAAALPTASTSASSGPGLPLAPGHANAGGLAVDRPGVTDPGAGAGTLRPTPGGGSAATPDHAPDTTAAPLDAAVDRACIAAGARQGLNLTGPAGLGVSYASQYSDGRNSNDYGGMGTGTIPPSGVYTATWVVAPAAPAGPVTIYAAAAGHRMSAFRQVGYRISGNC